MNDIENINQQTTAWLAHVVRCLQHTYVVRRLQCILYIVRYLQHILYIVRDLQHMLFVSGIYNICCSCPVFTTHAVRVQYLKHMYVI